MLKSISIEGYRGISKILIEDFSEINIFVGFNNSGKSTILESIFYLINPGNARLPISTNSFRDFRFVSNDIWTTYFNKHSKKSKIEITGILDNGEKRELVIEPRITSNLEPLSNNTTDLLTTQEQLSGSIFQNITGLRSNISIKHKKDHTKFSTELFLDQEKKAIIGSEKHSDDKNLGGVYLNSRNTASDDAERFNSLQIRSRKSIKSIVKFLKIIEPSLKDIVLGNNQIIYADIGVSSLLPVKLLGDGFGRAFSIALAIESFPEGIVIIDEIENGISYNILEEFWKYILKHSKLNNVQVFTATHSIETILAVYSISKKIKQPQYRLRVFRVEREEQHYNVVKFVSSTLGTSLEKGWEIR